MKDNRLNKLSGLLSSPGDLDEIFREICSNFGWQITKARAFVKNNNKPIDLISLVLLCKVFKLKMDFDVFKDEFTVFYQDRNTAPCFFEDEESDVVYIDDDGEIIVGEIASSDEEVEAIKTASEESEEGLPNENIQIDLSEKDGVDKVETPEENVVEESVDDLIAKGGPGGSETYDAKDGESERPAVDFTEVQEATKGDEDPF